MGVTFPEYDTVVHSIYDAALRPDRLRDVLDAICRLFRGPYGNLFSWTRDQREGGFFFSTFPPGILDIYRGLEDPHMQATQARGLMRAGVAVTNDQLLARSDLEASRLYREIWAPLDIHSMAGGVVFSAGDTHHLPTVFSVHRTRAEPPFDAADREVLERLTAHLSRALGVMFHLRDQALQVAASQAALDQLAAGVVLLDAAGRVEFLNRTARTMAATQDPIVLTTEGAAAKPGLSLASGLRHREAALRTAIRRALDPLTADVAEHFSQALVVEAADGEPRCAIHVAPLPLRHDFAPSAAPSRAIVFVYDVQASGTIAPQLLVDCFGLTPAEARVALAVLRGGDVAAIAQRLRVSPNTVKSQLQQVYAKIGVAHRADLLKVLLNLASARPGR